MTQAGHHGGIDTDLATAENFYTGQVTGPPWNVRRRYVPNGPAGITALAPIPPMFGTPELLNGILGYVGTYDVGVTADFFPIPGAVHLVAHGPALADAHRTGWQPLPNVIKNSVHASGPPRAALAAQRHGDTVIGIVNGPKNMTIVRIRSASDIQVVHNDPQDSTSEGWAPSVSADHLFVSDGPDPFVWSYEGSGVGAWDEPSDWCEFTGFPLSAITAVGYNHMVEAQDIHEWNINLTTARFNSFSMVPPSNVTIRRLSESLNSLLGGSIGGRNTVTELMRLNPTVRSPDQVLCYRQQIPEFEQPVMLKFWWATDSGEGFQELHRSGPTGAYRHRVPVPKGMPVAPCFVKPWSTDNTAAPDVWFLVPETKGGKPTGRHLIYRARWKAGQRRRIGHPYTASVIGYGEVLDDDAAFSAGTARYPRRNPAGRGFDQNWYRTQNLVGVVTDLPSAHPTAHRVIRVDRDRKRYGVLHMTVVFMHPPQGSGSENFSYFDAWWTTSNDDGRNWTTPVRSSWQ